MFDLAQIYLQIILEKEHKKKWSEDKEIRFSPESNFIEANLGER